MNRNKEDLRHERIIRGLTKLDDNRKCLNCGSLAPQYVCTTFSTFVCMACSGMHREFNHRVKSISMSKFSPEEVAALQAGGNQRALETFFKHWDSRRHPVPDSRNPERLKDFIKAIYVDQLYSANKPPPAKGDDHDIKRPSLRGSHLSSHSFEDRQRDRPSIHSHQRARSEDRPSYREYDTYSPPVRSMREILGDDLPALRIEPTSQTRLPTVDPERNAQISKFGSFVGGGSAPDIPQQTYQPSYSENLGTAQQPYVKANTTGWATFDTAPTQEPAQEPPVEGGPWNPKQETVGSTWSNMESQFVAQEPRAELPEDIYASAAGYLPGLPQFNPDSIMMETTTVRRKSINPFEHPDDCPAPMMNTNFAFHQPIASTSFAPSSMPEIGEQPHHPEPWSQPISYPPAPGVLSSYGGYISTNMPSFTPDFQNFQQQSRPGNPFS